MTIPATQHPHLPDQPHTDQLPPTRTTDPAPTGEQVGTGEWRAGSATSRLTELELARSLARRQTVVFTAVVFAIALTVSLTLPHSAVAPAVTVAVPLIGVALITIFLTPPGQRKALWRSLGLRHAGVRSWPAALLLPLLFLAAGYGAAALLGIASFHRPAWLLPNWAYTVVSQLINLVVATLFLLGEEIGWRGFLLPRLQVLLSPRWGAVATGFIHGLFHLPLILFTTTYDMVGSRYLVAPLVVATVTAAGVFYAWLRNRSGSIWPVAIAHATSNTVFALAAAAVATSAPAALAYTAGESGIATLIAVAGCALWLLGRASWPTATTTQPADSPG